MDTDGTVKKYGAKEVLFPIDHYFFVGSIIDDFGGIYAVQSDFGPVSTRGVVY